MDRVMAAQPTLGGTGQTVIDPKLTQAMIQQGVKPGPVTSNLQAFAKMGTAAIGGVLQNLRTDQIQAVRQKIAQSLEGLPGVGPEELKFAQSLLSTGKFNEAISFTKAARDRAAKVAEFDRARTDKFPATRKRISGGDFIIEQKGPDGTVTEISRGSRFAPKSKSELDRLFETAGMTAEDKKKVALAILSSKGQKFGGSITLADGTTIEFGPRGGTAKDSGRAFKNIISKKSINTAEELARINGIAAKFDPDFLTFGGKIEQWWVGVKDRFQLGSISPEDEEKYDRYVRFHRRAIDNAVLRLNALSGAAVTPHEFRRVVQTLPDPGGVTLFDILTGKGDTPKQFLSKLEDVQYSLKASLMRLHFYRANGGVSPKGSIPFDAKTGKVGAGFLNLLRFEDRMDESFDEITDRLRSEGKSGQGLFEARDKAMQEIYGPVWGK